MLSEVVDIGRRREEGLHAGAADEARARISNTLTLCCWLVAR
jgi:hypothetical protein